MQEYCFEVNNRTASLGVLDGLYKIYDSYVPVIICVGTDATIGDALGPMIGTKLKEANIDAYVYGSLSTPITAKEILSVKDFVKAAHPLSKTLVIDAAVGEDGDVGIVKISGEGIRPGLGADKNLPKMGDGSIIGIVSPRSKGHNYFMNYTRLAPIYKMAEIIAEGIIKYVRSVKEKPIYKSEDGKFSLMKGSDQYNI